MKQIFFLLIIMIPALAVAQEAKPLPGDSFTVTVHKDPRLLLLANKQEPYIGTGIYQTKGYRLMVLSTTDRQQAISVRSTLLQHFPDQKVYMTFQPPYVKVKFGNFLEKSEADKFKLEIKKGNIVTTNIYLVPETVEVKGDRLRDNLDRER